MSSSAPRRKKKRQDGRSRGDSCYVSPIICVGCEADVSTASYAQLDKGHNASNDDSCTHIVCMVCFGRAHAIRSAEIKLQCPSDLCDRSSREWSMYEFSDGQHLPPVSQRIVVPVRDSVDMRNHPTLYYSNQPRQYRKAHALISVSTADPDNNRKTNTYTAELKINQAENNNTDNDNLERVGRTLHPYLLPTTKDKASQSHLTFANPHSVSINQLEAGDISPLRRFIHGLSTGKKCNDISTRKEYESKPLYQKEYNSSYTAGEIIRATKGGGHRSSPLKNLISDRLTASNVNNSVISFLSRIGLSKSNNYITISSDKAVEQKIKEGWDPKGRGYGIIVGAYDNIGFRKMTGYVQYTLLSILFFSATYLISIGVYPDPKLKPEVAYEHPDYKTSFNCLDWDEVKDDYHFCITPADASMLLKEVTLPTIQFVLEAMEDGSFPNLDCARSLIGSRTDISFGTNVPHNATARRSVKLQESSVDGNVQQSTDTGQVTDIDASQINNVNELDDDYLTDEEEDVKSIYGLNNVTTDLPMQQDLNCNNTLKSLINYYCGLSNRCLAETYGCHDRAGMEEGSDNDSGDEMSENLSHQNPWAYAGWEKKDWPMPWMRTLGPILCGDGQPTFGMLRLQESHPEYQERNFTPFNGGFHTMLELHKMRGKLFGPSHLRSIWRSWRASESQLNWVMTPGDPNQVDDELIWYHFGMIASAILALMDERNEDESSEGGISATDVHEFMLRKAKGCAVTQIILVEMRFAEVALLLHQAEEASDATKFVTAIKLASLLITTTHATKYTFIHAKFLVWWHCASDAEKTIFEKIILTKKTVKGKNIFTDRFVEWMVKDMRNVVGKHHRVGTKNKLNRAAVLLEAKTSFNLSQDKDKDNVNEEERITKSKLGKVFCESLVFCVGTNLWKSTDVKRLSLRDNLQSINPEMISILSIGEQRMDQSIDKLKGNIDENDAEAEVRDSTLLRTIQPTMEKQTNDDLLDAERAVSTTFSFVKEKYKLTELRVEYRKLRDNWDRESIGEDFPKKGSAGNNDAYSTAICNARELLIAHDPLWTKKNKINNRRKECRTKH